MNKELATKILKANYRITKSRKDIIECLSDSHHSHTINSIVFHLEQKNKKANLMSIYNNLNLLIKEGIIFARLNYSTSELEYELTNSDSFHLHIYDIDSKKEITDIISSKHKKDILNYLANKNFDLINFDLTLMIKIKK